MTKPHYSNCLLGALIVRFKKGGKLHWWPGWNNGWAQWPQHPWGHFYVQFENYQIHFDDLPGNDLKWWQQLWFKGHYQIKR